MSKSLILEFYDENHRDVFINEKLRPMPDLMRKVHLSENLPNLILDDLNPAEVSFVQKIALPDVRVHEDIRFHTFSD